MWDREWETGVDRSRGVDLLKHAVDITKAMPPVPDIPEAEARTPRVTVDKGINPMPVDRAIASLPPGVRDELARAGVTFHATSAAFLAREAGIGTMGLYEPEKLTVHVAADFLSSDPLIRRQPHDFDMEHVTLHEAGHALDHILGAVSTRAPSFWRELGDQAFPNFGSYPRTNESEAFAELFAAVSTGQWAERHEAFDYVVPEPVREKATAYMKQLGIRLSAISAPSCVAKWDGTTVRFGPPGTGPVSLALAAAGLITALAHEQHVATVKGSEWYDQPIGSLIVKKPHPSHIESHQRLVWMLDHPVAVPKQAQVYVPAGTDVSDQAAVAKAWKFVKYGPPGNVHVAKIEDNVNGEPSIFSLNYNLTTEQTLKDKWKLLPAAEAKAGASILHAQGGNIDVTSEQIASAIKVLKDAKSTNVKPPLAKAGHPLADMDYVQIAKDEIAAHPELNISPGTKAVHVGKVKNAVLHHLAGKLAEADAATMAEKAAAEHVKEVVQEQSQAAHKLTPSVMDFHGLAVSKNEMQAAADAVDATGSHGSLSAALKKIGSPLATLDHYDVAKTWKKDHPEDKGLSTKAAYTKAIHDVLADLEDADEVTGHEDPPSSTSMINGADQSYVGTASEQKIGYTSVNAALAAALVASKNLGKPLVVEPNHADSNGAWHWPPFKPVSLGTSYYRITPDGKVDLRQVAWSGGMSAPDQVTEIDDASLLAMVGQYLAAGQPENLVGQPEPEPPPEPTGQNAYAELRGSTPSPRAKTS